MCPGFISANSSLYLKLDVVEMCLPTELFYLLKLIAMLLSVTISYMYCNYQMTYEIGFMPKIFILMCKYYC